MDNRDRERKKAWKATERQRTKAAFPLPDEGMARLFANVADAVEANGCDHSLRATEAWLAEEACDRGAVLDWLRANGGYCDCEVVANAVEEWESSR